MDWKLELVPLPVADVDRAKNFYTEKVGFKLDHDVRHEKPRRTADTSRLGVLDRLRGGNRADGAGVGAGPALGRVRPSRGTCALLERGVEASEVKDFGGGISFVFFKDPDGNSWAVQHIAPGAGRPK